MLVLKAQPWWGCEPALNWADMNIFLLSWASPLGWQTVLKSHKAPTLRKKNPNMNYSKYFPSPTVFWGFFQFLAWFSKIMWCYKMPASPAALWTWSLLGTFSQTWGSRTEFQGNMMAMQKRWRWTHTSQESQKEEGKESNSLSEFLQSGKASVEPRISKQQSILMGEQFCLRSLLRDAHTLQLQLNSVKSQSSKRQASIGKQALLVWLLMEWFAY